MKIQSSNKLAHYQVEFTELQEQTAMLNAQLPGLQDQVQQIQAYLSVNNGDRMARANYSKCLQRYNSVCSAIRRNQMRMQTLQRQIACESQRILMSQQRAMMTAARVPGRSYYGRYPY